MFLGITICNHFWLNFSMLIFRKLLRKSKKNIFITPFLENRILFMIIFEDLIMVASE